MIFPSKRVLDTWAVVLLLRLILRTVAQKAPAQKGLQARQRDSPAIGESPKRHGPWRQALLKCPEVEGAATEMAASMADKAFCGPGDGGAGDALFFRVCFRTATLRGCPP